VLAAVLGAAATVVASPYLARLTLSVPEREERAWWRGRSVTSRRRLLTAGVALLLGGLAGAAAGWGALFPAYLALALLGTPLMIIDVEWHRLPDRLMLPAVVAAAVLLAVAAGYRADWSAYLRSAEAGAAVFAVLFVLAFAAPRSFGFGDVKLGGLLGGYLGWFGWLTVYYGIFCGFLFGLIAALALLATRRASLKSAMAFGPMLMLGALVVLAFGLSPDVGGNF
jgi:leader peptidase (prepilin peptidase)/N-methyltransferase